MTKNNMKTEMVPYCFIFVCVVIITCSFMKKGVIIMLQKHEVKHYLLSLNAIKYKYDDTEFNRRSNFVCKMCGYYGYLSYSQIIDMFENC